MKTSLSLALTLVLATMVSSSAQISSTDGESRKESPGAPPGAQGRAAAVQVLEDLRMIDSAIDQFAIENNKATGAPILWENLLPYLKPGTRLYGSGGKDPLGNAYIIKAVDTPPRVSAKTAAAFDVPANFWDPFGPDARAEGAKKENPAAPAAKQGRAAANDVLTELRLIDSAIDQYAIENNKAEGAPVIWANLLPYLKPGTRLHGSGGKDPSGNAYIIKAVGIPPKPSAKTAAMFDVPVKFWDPYLPE